MALPEIFWQTAFWLYIIAAVVQLAAWWGLFARLAFWKKLSIYQPTDQSQINQSTSIIICARNEADNLRRHLPAILSQEYEGQWELIVVDDASEDETQAVLQFFQEKNPERMRVLRIDEKTSPGKKYALSQGIAAARYDYLLLTDADCEPASPYWLAHMAAMLTSKPETEIALGYGPNLTTFKKWSNFQAVSLWSRYETAFVAAQYFSFALAGMPYMGVGRNLAFNRQAFNRIGGFSEHLHIPSGDDDLLVNAAATAHNTVICLTPESFMYSDAPINWSSWFGQKQRHLAASSLYRWTHKTILGGIGLSHAGFYFLFILLLFAGVATKIVVGIFLFRLLSVQLIFGKILRGLRESDLFWRIPLYDGLLAVYYGAVVPWFLIKKNSAGWGSTVRSDTF